MTNDKKWLSIAEFADHLKISLAQARNYANQNKVKAEKIGQRAWAVDRQDAERLKKEREAKGEKRGTWKRTPR